MIAGGNAVLLAGAGRMPTAWAAYRSSGAWNGSLRRKQHRGDHKGLRPCRFYSAGGVILTALWVVGGHVDKSLLPLGSGTPAFIVPSVQSIADAKDCTRPVGSTTVAILNSTPLVTVFANGVPLVLVLDTGAQRTVLTPAAAKRIGAKTPRVEFQRGLRGISGGLPTREVELHSFAVGHAAIPWHRVTVAAIVTPPVFSTALDGVLGADVFSSFDIDLDLPRHRMVLYEKGACPGPNWPGRYAEISTGRSLSDHLFFPVQLDRHRLTAIVDTGAQRTTLSTTIARAIGVTEAVLAGDRSTKTKGSAGEALNSHLHRFNKLDVGGIVVRNPEIVVTDLRVRDVDLILGIDFIRSRKLWLSYASFRIFLSY
jgi:predicted aspartyl protease